MPQGIPVRGITLFLFGGVAELGEEPKSALGEFFMAIAGPVVTIILSIGLALLTYIGYHSGWLPQLVIVFGYLASINVLVFLFNMMPAFPLDGGRVLRSILWGATGDLLLATKWASLLGQFFGWMLIVLGILQLFNGDLIDGVWYCLIGWFLHGTAYGSYQDLRMKQERKKCEELESKELKNE